MRNYSARYISELVPARKSMLPGRKKDRERECKKRIELSATVKRYISDAIVIGERRAAFLIRISNPFAVISTRENSRSGQQLCVPFRIIRQPILGSTHRVWDIVSPYDKPRTAQRRMEDVAARITRK